MQKLLFAVTTVVCFAACGTSHEDDHERAAKPKAKLRVPILEEVTVGNKTVKRPIHDVHKEIPLFVELSGSSKPFNDVIAKIDKLNETIRAREPIQVVSGGAVDSYQISKSIRMCYSGDAHAAVKMLFDLTDSVISEMFLLHAYRVGKGKFTGEGQKLSKEEEDEIPVPTIWNEWKGLAGAILLVTSTNDGGDEFSPAVLIKCKDQPEIVRSNARLISTDSEGKKVTIALDAGGTPHIDGDAKTFPTIKDFDEGAELSGACYKGSDKDTRTLLEALVFAADGDGDSFAELDSVKLSKKTKEFTVTAIITNEAGVNENTYTFGPCGG